ncbi:MULTISPECIES: hypothetical protein [unclassified Sphingomonas]|uniref:hypothetical protein n=1 Tax=unclassified Sphingomonas TaxID=196159 RepID=UPI00226ADC9A|nr:MULTISPECIES: hypothetical protein [unclassified Sphingomonas]
MMPAVTGTLIGGVTACYVPLLRDQIRDGEIGIPLTGTNPIKVRRIEHPWLFRASVVGQIVLVTLLLAAAVVLLAEAVLR